MFREDVRMEEQHAADEQSHYEISLTAGQAFVAFVLLLLSLAASFAFGLMLGKGQTDERLVVRKENPVVTEASLVPRTNTGEIVDVVSNDFGSDDEEPAEPAKPALAEEPKIVEEAAPENALKADPASVAVAGASASAAPPIEDARPEPTKTSVPAETTAAKPASSPKASTERIPHYAQLLSTGDQKAAEGLAVKLINRGFTTAYVERGTSEKGAVYRVRVRFASESEARAAESRLREFSNEVWITAR